MAEAEWLTCADPDVLLAWRRRRGMDRTFRLFACACCRRIWHLLSDQGRNAIEVIEAVADGRQHDRELDAVEAAARAAASQGMHASGLVRAKALAAQAVLSATGAATYGTGASGCAAYVRLALSYERIDPPSIEGMDPVVQGEKRAQCAIIRDLLGNPFRPVPFDPLCRSPVVLAGARLVYDESRWADLPLLADALEEAGCTSADLLAHLRSPTDHVRGCWALDLVLGKQ